MSGETTQYKKRSVGQRVRPEPVTDKSFVENVTGFINEVVPQTSQNPSHYEGKERITWVKFEECDANDLSQFKDRIELNGNSPPFLLLIGYVNGIQAWAIPSNGEGIEVFSWRQGPVRALKVLVSPKTSEVNLDLFSLKRPILAICDAAGPGPPYHSVSFISLKTGEQLKTIKFKSSVQDIHANRNVIIISFPEKLAVFSAATFDDLFTISTCFPCPGPCLNPIALGDQWLAYADRRLYAVHQSCGGMVVDGALSYKTTVLYAAKSITKGLKELGESVASNLMGQRTVTPQPPVSTSSQKTPGIVTIIDTEKVNSSEVNLSTGFTSGLIAHFMAHQGAPIVSMHFDPSGLLLATADKLGHNFNIFRIQPHPISSTQAAVHHLYVLHRGDTTAKVMDISFSLDSRWIAVSTHRGTTHVYPITPYGGNVGVRTHKSVCVVNRLSRFQRSAGLDDASSSGRNSPVLSTSPNTSKFGYEPSPNLAFHNPRYPPYPVPTILQPLAQLRQPLLQNLIDSIVPGISPSHSPPSTSRSPKIPGPEEIVKVSSIFGTSRGWLAGSPTVPREIKRKAVDSLFVMAYHGNLIEYYLEPRPEASLSQEKVTENSPIELEVHATAQWSLVRETTSPELRPPLSPDSPIMVPLFPQRSKSLSPSNSFENIDPEESWMAQVEIYTHAGPHRRLWMGPQFAFKSLPGTGNLAGGQSLDDAGSEGSLHTGFLHRSSPVNMPGHGVVIEDGSFSGSHQSLKLMERYSSESDACDQDNILNKLRNQIADAMMDTQTDDADIGKPLNRCSSNPSDEVEIDDLSDIMDINCDPPGPSSGSGRPTPVHVSYKSDDDSIQSINSKMHQIAVTSNPGFVSDAQPFWGSRTPSLEECHGMTSSAEELASTLAGNNPDKSDFAWKPIDPPSSTCSGKDAAKSYRVERPKPLDAREKGGESVPSQNKAKKGPDCSKDGSTHIKKNNPEVVMVAEASRSSWAQIAQKKDDNLAEPLNQCPLSSTPKDDGDFPPVSLSAKTAGKSGGKTSAASGTTSEDDLFPAKEGKKDRKKRKKKNKPETPSEPDVSISDWSWNPIEDLGAVQVLTHSVPQDESTQVLPSLEMEADHFHTAEEFHETSLDEFHDPVPHDHFLETEVVDEFLNPCHNDDENGNAAKGVMLRSIHDDDDLAKALEEASSDESLPIRTTVPCKGKEANEMFPFCDSSSDDEGKMAAVRHRVGLPIAHLVDEDREETSGDDRKTTSESDVTASPNPRAAGNSKGKKKKKKKK